MTENQMKELEDRNIKLWTDGGKLHYKAPEGALRTEDIAFLKENKPDVLRYLTVPNENREIRSACAGIGDAALAEIDPRLFESWYRTAQAAALGSVMNVFQATGIFCSEQEAYEFGAIVAAVKVQEKLVSFLKKWLDIFVKEGILDQQKDSYRLKDLTYKINDFREKWAQLAELEAQFHFGEGFVSYLIKCGERLGELFSGEIQALELLFPEGTMDTAVATYQKTMTSVILNKMARTSIIEAAGNPARGCVDILEVGAGVGGTSNEMIPWLSELNVHYYYTDVSRYFLNDAKQRFHDRQWIDYALYDINKSYYSQGFGQEQFDIILCANVLHNARNGYTVLRQLQEMLKRGGLLIVLDETKEPYFLLSSIGFNEGLSDFEDSRKDHHGVFFAEEAWDDMFRASGFEKIYQFPDKADVLSLAGQTIFIVRKGWAENYAPEQEQSGEEPLGNQISHVADGAADYEAPM
ncbi:MAG: methyltransferase, partial [Lachnospiraceae bacterium]